jgi:hypothetical protein
MATGCTSKPPVPQLLDTSAAANAAIDYVGAWSVGGFGVALAPQGAAILWITKTTTLAMKAYGNGQGYRVVVGIGPEAKATVGKVRKCSCLAEVTLLKGLNENTHIVTVINSSRSLQLVVHGWAVDIGGGFRRVGAGFADPQRTVTPGNPLSFYVRNTSMVLIDYVPTGAVLDIYLDDRPDPYHLVTNSTSSSGGSLSRAVIAWGLHGGLEKLTINVVTGSLSLPDIALFEAPGKGSPSIVPESEAEGASLLMVYGDGIGEGLSSLGFNRDADGFADRLIQERGWRLSDHSSAGASASCFGVSNVDSVAAMHPDRVIVAFGTNDMIPGPDAQGCDPTLGRFRAAMHSILSRLRLSLPGVPIYVQAILPTLSISDSTRSLWNTALQSAATANNLPFVEPGAHLSTTTDYSGPIYPNNRGAQKIADFWNSFLLAQ